MFEHELITKQHLPNRFLILVHQSGNISIARGSGCAVIAREEWDSIKETVDEALVEHDRMRAKLDV